MSFWARLAAREDARAGAVYANLLQNSLAGTGFVGPLRVFRALMNAARAVKKRSQLSFQDDCYDPGGTTWRKRSLFNL